MPHIIESFSSNLGKFIIQPSRFVCKCPHGVPSDLVIHTISTGLMYGLEDEYSQQRFSNTTFTIY